MQREIAEVMASCALRGFRYISFPPIVFDPPKPAPAPEPEPVAEEAAPPEAPAALVAPPVEAPPPPAMTPEAPAPAALAPEPAPAAPPHVIAAAPAPLPAPEPPAAPIAAPISAPAMRRLTEFATLAAEPQAPPARLRRLAELTAAESLDPPGEGATPRRFALLNDIAVELRPRRVRARSSRRP